MDKKMVVRDFIAAVLIIMEIIIINLMVKKIGVIAYILIDAVAIAVISFAVNYIFYKISKKGNIKTNILNSLILTYKNVTL